jgi:hypothetical protein
MTNTFLLMRLRWEMQAVGLHICVRWSQNEQLHDQNGGVNCAGECIGCFPSVMWVLRGYKVGTWFPLGAYVQSVRSVVVSGWSISHSHTWLMTHDTCGFLLSYIHWLSFDLGLSSRVFAARTLVHAQIVTLFIWLIMIWLCGWCRCIDLFIFLGTWESLTTRHEANHVTEVALKTLGDLPDMSLT